MSAPQRIQLRRTRGYRKPGGAIVVARPSRWGNPYRVGDGEMRTRRDVVECFREDLVAALTFPWRQPIVIDIRNIAESLHELAGHDLACWCPLVDAEGHRVPCHADVLLELSNPGWRP